MNYRRILIGLLIVLLSTCGTLMTVDYIDDYFNLRVKERIAIYFRTVYKERNRSCMCTTMTWGGD